MLINLVLNFVHAIGVSFVPPTVLVLLQILSGARRAQDLLPPGSVIPLPRNKVVELSIPGGLIGGEVCTRMKQSIYSILC